MLILIKKKSYCCALAVKLQLHLSNLKKKRLLPDTICKKKDLYLQKKTFLMTASSFKINLFLLVNLPSAFFCGVRTKYIDNQQCVVTVKHRWINQNPFKSMYFAVQAMAAELSTGALVLIQIKKVNKNISMLVANSKSNFTKKATGRITFTCNDGYLIEQAIATAIATNLGQTVWMKSVGIDQKGDQVSEFDFEWSVRVKV